MNRQRIGKQYRSRKRSSTKAYIHIVFLSNLHRNCHFSNRFLNRKSFLWRKWLIKILIHMWVNMLAASWITHLFPFVLLHCNHLNSFLQLLFNLTKAPSASRLAIRPTFTASRVQWATRWTEPAAGIWMSACSTILATSWRRAPILVLASSAARVPLASMAPTPMATSPTTTPWIIAGKRAWTSMSAALGSSDARSILLASTRLWVRYKFKKK